MSKLIPFLVVSLLVLTVNASFFDLNDPTSQVNTLTRIRRGARRSCGSQKCRRGYDCQTKCRRKCVKRKMREEGSCTAAGENCTILTPVNLKDTITTKYCCNNYAQNKYGRCVKDNKDVLKCEEKVCISQGQACGDSTKPETTGPCCGDPNNSSSQGDCGPDKKCILSPCVPPGQECPTEGSCCGGYCPNDLNDALPRKCVTLT